MVEAPQGRKGVAQFDVRLPKSVRARSVQECPQLEVGLTCRRGERMPADGTSRSWAASGKTVNWFGKADVQREYIYVPDAMRTAAAAGARAEAFGAHWCLPGGGPLSGRQAADIAGRHLERPVKLRSAGLTTLRIVGCSTRICVGCCRWPPII
jgi:hypothetical protein